MDGGEPRSRQARKVTRLNAPGCRAERACSTRSDPAASVYFFVVLNPGGDGQADPGMDAALKPQDFSLVHGGGRASSSWDEDVIGVGRLRDQVPVHDLSALLQGRDCRKLHSDQLQILHQISSRA